MAHRKKPTTKEGVKSWNAEHKGTKKSGGGWKYAIPGVGPLLATSDANKIRSRNRTKLTNNKTNNNLTQKDKDDIRKEKETESVAVTSGQYKRVKKDGGTVLQKVNKTVNKKVVKKDKDPNAAYKPKAGTAASRIQQKLRDGGHKQEDLNFKARRHDDWKKARKAGTLGDWEKKYHPGRTPEYRNKKNKSSSKNGSNRSGLQAGKTESTSTGSPKHKPGGPNSQFKKDGTPKTPLKKKKKKQIGTKLAEKMFG